MNNTKIKIFLASSGEMKAERKAIWELTAEVGKLFPELHLDPYEWEIDLPAGSVRAEYIQAEISPKLLESDIVFVLFYSKAGAFTIEELRLAMAAGKKVFVYFKKGFSPDSQEENERYAEVLKIASEIEADNRILSKKYSEGGLKEIYQMDLAKHLTVAPTRRIRTLHAKDLHYIDLDSLRELPKNRLMREYYFLRRSDEALRQALSDSDRRFILVKGFPLAGKTRACLEALHLQPNLCLLIPDLYGHECWRIDANDSNSLLIFNDFDVFCEVAGKARINEFLHQCFSQKVRVLATCKTGPEYNILRNTVETRFWENVAEVEISRLQQSEFEFIERHFLAHDIRLDKDAYLRLDYNVGSLFLDLKTMSERYRKIKNDEDSLPHAILQTLKAFFVGYNRLHDGSYSKKKIKFYLHEYDGGVEHPPAKWDKAFARLESSNTGDGFLRFTENGNILIEEAYLRVVLNDVQDWKYKEEIEELFPDALERSLFGFFGVHFWTIRLNEKARLSKQEGEDFLREMEKSGVLPNEVTFTSLINKAIDVAEAHYWFDRMVESGTQPNTITFNSLISLCKDLNQGFNILNKMKAAKVEPDTVTFNSLIPLCRNLEQGLGILKKMENAKVERNTRTFNSLIPLCKDLETGLEILKKMETAKVERNLVTYSSLIPLCKDLEQGLGILKKMEAAKVEPDARAFNSLIPLCKNLEMGLEILKKMETAKVERNLVTYRSLIPLCKDLEQGLGILKKMKAAKVEPDARAFNSLIPLCKDLEQGFEILEKMEATKVAPDAVMYTKLIPLCKDLEQGFEILEKINLAKFKRSPDTYTSLIPLCKNLDEGFKILEKMKAAKIQRNTGTYTMLFPLCKDLYEGFKIMEKMETAKVERNIGTFISLMQLCNDLEQGFEIFGKMKAMKIEPTATIFNSMISLCKNFDQGFKVLEMMKAAGQKANLNSITPLFRLVEFRGNIVDLEQFVESNHITVNDSYTSGIAKLRKKYFLDTDY